MNMTFEMIKEIYDNIHRENMRVTPQSMIDALEHIGSKTYIDAETLWDKHCFSLDDRRSQVVSVKALLNGFEDDCEDFCITRESFDNIVEGLEKDDQGHVWDEDLFEYLSYYLEHAPKEVRI